MRIIKTGEKLKIYGNSLELFTDGLPAGFYTVGFDQMEGPFLLTYPNITIGEKIYGVHTPKVEKVLNAFDRTGRSLGVILSGDKGIGKSLFSKILAIESVNRGCPVILVNTFFPGIADFLNSIEQEVMLLFDEFDKTFRDYEGEGDQAMMLSLFDGMAQGKKLFCITCNNLYDLNSFLVNRPGRFHYHFRFGYPTATEIEEYLKDNILEAYYDEIEAVIRFASKIKLNYDCLRAIAFELNGGYTFNEAIQDLNIINTDYEVYNLTFHFADGRIIRRKGVEMDMFSDETEKVTVYSESGVNIGEVSFIPSDAKFDSKNLCSYIDDGIEFVSRQEKRQQEEFECGYKNATAPEHNSKDSVVRIDFKYKIKKDLHYNVR